MGCEKSLADIHNYNKEISLEMEEKKSIKNSNSISSIYYKTFGL